MLTNQRSFATSRVLLTKIQMMTRTMIDLKVQTLSCKYLKAKMEEANIQKEVVTMQVILKKSNKIGGKELFCSLLNLNLKNFLILNNDKNFKTCKIDHTK